MNECLKNQTKSLAHKAKVRMAKSCLSLNYPEITFLLIT